MSRMDAEGGWAEVMGTLMGKTDKQGRWAEITPTKSPETVLTRQTWRVRQA